MTFHKPDIYIAAASKLLDDNDSNKLWNTVYACIALNTVICDDLDVAYRGVYQWQNEILREFSEYFRPETLISECPWFYDSDHRIDSLLLMAAITEDQFIDIE